MYEDINGFNRIVSYEENFSAKYRDVSGNRYGYDVVFVCL